MTVTLSISVVSYRSKLDLLRQTLHSVVAAIAVAQGSGYLAAAQVDIIENDFEPAEELDALAKMANANLICGHGNIGYGLGHNLSLLDSAADFHLVLNPDVIVEPDALAKALDYMAAHPHVIMLAPLMRSADGRAGHLCRRYPTVLALAMRGLAPDWLRKRFAKELAKYEIQELSIDKPTEGIPIISGSFMFCRRAPIAAIGGFSNAFFVYFEDFDLSLRASKVGSIAFAPQVRATHFGGHAARKGIYHLYIFIKGAWTFFKRNGWQWW